MRDPRMEAFVQQVRAQTDILAVVQGYVPLKRKGNRYWGCCPFHNEKTASFSVVPADGFFYCFGCHAGGDAFKFISLMEHITPFEAIVRQAEQLGIEKPAQKRDPREEARLRELDDLRKVNALARDFFHNCLTMTRYGAAGLSCGARHHGGGDRAVRHRLRAGRVVEALRCVPKARHLREPPCDGRACRQT